MSKNSSKQLVTQYKEWLSTRNPSSTLSKSRTNFSKADHYKKSKSSK